MWDNATLAKQVVSVPTMNVSKAGPRHIRVLWVGFEGPEGIQLQPNNDFYRVITCPDVGTSGSGFYEVHSEVFLFRFRCDGR